VDASAVLVVGSDRDARPLVGHLQHAGFSAWSDRVGRVAGDCVSFAWADAIVVVDYADHFENLRLVREFAGPKVLVTTSSLTASDRATLLDGGLDAIVTAPCDRELLTARLRRTLAPRLAA
jgi:DNA-binding response OmpR family regulator